jgi:glycyl-tRNA synthetase beta chain
MKVNQRYFALRDAAGKPAPYFAFVSNLEATDGGRAIIAGNERVLRARLSDARHFWDMDLKTPLDELLPKLDKIVFHAKIGSQGQRAERIGEISKKIAETMGLDGNSAKQAEWAGRLSKADLVTGMVGEFPELQGIMGGYYAERNPRAWDGTVVGQAIKSHYQPKGPFDAVPASGVPAAVALADKLDTLVEFFRINEKPTGSSDPYALRRAALGVIRIILENEISAVDLGATLFDADGLLSFIFDRLKVKLRGEGKRFDILDAVFCVSADGNLARLMKRVDALSEMLNTEDGKSLHAAYKRAANILRIEDPNGQTANKLPDAALFKEQAEFEFLGALNAVRTGILDNFLLENEHYRDVMTRLATLRPGIDSFFQRVTVNDPRPEIRQNRLRLLSEFCKTVHYVADFSKIEG